MRDNQRMATLKCDCGCCMVVAEKSVWGENDVWYDVSIQDSHFDSPNTIRNRIRRAINALFGKPIYFNDATVREEEFAKFVDGLRELQDWMPEASDGK